MRSLAAGVTIVTARDPQGRLWGMTATAVCLVSWEPPLLLVCIDRKTECHRPLVEAGAFAINLLEQDQESLSQHFAGKDVAKFEGVSWSDSNSGAPILEGVLAHVECRTTTCYAAGDHTILLGEAVGGALAAGAEKRGPLIYFRGKYARLAPIERRTQS
jgi:flavin reductase (DIM6/NTAB) family NADH-FMN oxidoreductase RutF